MFAEHKQRFHSAKSLFLSHQIALFLSKGNSKEG